MHIYHRHHIVPRHMGGTDNPSNLIKLTIQEHAAWHYELWVYWGKREDWIAWKFLTGQSNDPEVWLEKSKLGGEIIGSKLRGKPQTPKQAKHNEARRIASTGRIKSIEEREKIRQSKIGKARPDLANVNQKTKSKQINVVFPDGHTEIITNIRKFCRDFGLNRRSLKNVLEGKWKQYKGYVVTYSLNSQFG